MEVPEVELRSSIIAGEDVYIFLCYMSTRHLLISCRVVQDDCVHLVRVVELRSLVLLDDEG
jgi:hypothetical protein